MEVKYAIALFGVLPLAIMLIVSWWVQYHMNKSNERLIQAQQDTIQRLINREPVTYAETGQNPQKPNKEIYAAWGNQMINIDEDDVKLK